MCYYVDASEKHKGARMATVNGQEYLEAAGMTEAEFTAFCDEQEMIEWMQELAQDDVDAQEHEAYLRGEGEE